MTEPFVMVTYPGWEKSSSSIVPLPSLSNHLQGEQRSQQQNSMLIFILLFYFGIFVGFMADVLKYKLDHVQSVLIESNLCKHVILVQL